MQICMYKEKKSCEFLTWESKHRFTNESVCVLVSPSEDTGLQTGISGSSPEHKTEA